MVLKRAYRAFSGVATMHVGRDQFEVDFVLEEGFLKVVGYFVI